MTSLATQLNNIKKLKVKQERQRLNAANVSPLESVTLSIRHDIAKSVSFCAKALKLKSTFSGLTDHQLNTLAQSMTKISVPCGTLIAQQNSLGDRCYILESGVLGQSRQLLDDSFLDMDDISRESVFGEMCFFTDELCPAFITVKSETADLYMLMKMTYLSIMDSTKQIVVEIRDQLAKDVVEKVKIFQKLTSSHRAHVIDAMVPVIFPERTYICRQGKLGKGFYVITEGKCAVTYTNPDGGEHEVRMLESGDYFGRSKLIN